MLKRTRLVTKRLRLSPISQPRLKMSTFTLPEKESVTVTIPNNLFKEDLTDFRPFTNWLQALQQNLELQKKPKHAFHECPYELKNINVQAADWFGERLGFIKFQVEVENEELENLPGSVFLRGPSVAMMVLLQPDDLPEGSQGEKQALLTVQPRIPAASLAFSELPAGMVDDSGTFAGAAAKEIKEELGLTIAESELINLTELAIPHDTEEALPRAIFPSPGGSDEYISIFLHEKRVPRDQLKGWTGKLTGLRDQGEKITLKLVKLEDLWKEGARDGKTAAAYGLYVGLKGEGKI